MSHHFAVIGGDARQVKLAQLLSQHSRHVTAFGMDETPPSLPVHYTQNLSEAVGDADCVVLPIPLLQRDGQLNMPLMARAIAPSALLSVLQKGQVVAAGLVPESFRQACLTCGVEVVDYANREELAIRNAVPTVEAALQIAMEKMPVTLHGSRALVIGNGRIGKLLARALQALGAQVSVSARRVVDKTWVEVLGGRSLDTARLTAFLPEFDVIFNTVPHAVLGESELAAVARHCLLIDLASAPGGIDIDAAKRNGNPCIWALALPGKHSPTTAAANLCATICAVMAERSENHE